MKRYFLLFLFLSGKIFAQSDKEIAVSKCREAIKLMDGGQIEESIKLLEECIKLDPENMDFPYEMGYANYIAKDYKKTIALLTPLADRKDPNDRVFQLLGNSFDNIGESKKAIEVYEAGLKKIPRSGKLYLELGTLHAMAKEYDKAIRYYESGVNVEPEFPSNYYHLARMFLGSDEEVWGMIYGEIFMNLERNSARTAEISKLLYDTYKSEIKFSSDTTFSVSFSKSFVVDARSIKKIEIPFGMGVYEPLLITSTLGEKNIDITSLDRIRTTFVKNYFDTKKDKKYPNLLFDYQQALLKEGHLQAYNHWILMKGDEEGFNAWYEANREKWDKFVAWFNPNVMTVNNKNKFLRGQYE